ncbi:MAG: hypothetical protein KDE33_16325 [Bacteroidetes bacterium]|nr:hypothetical protein [Bacteroidota bacterium]
MEKLDDKITNVLTQYFTVEDALLQQKIVNELKATALPAVVEESKKKFLQQIELHHQANDLIEIEVKKYRENIYQVSKQIASREMEDYIITRAHVIKAKEFLWHKKRKYDYSDGLLGFGGLLLGTSIPHVINLMSNLDLKPNVILIILGIVGGILFGMGMIWKAKN